MKKYLILLFLVSQISLAQRATARKAVSETIELITKNSYKLLSLKSADELITSYSTFLVKNGLGRETRISNSAIKNILEDINTLRGKDDLIKVGQKLSTLNSNNLNSIKGFLAEELHFNELLKLKNIDNINLNSSYKTSDFVQSKQLEFIKKNRFNNKDLYLHKQVEIDLIASKNNNKFLIEVKNIDSNFSESRFLKYFSQIVKQKAFADENGIKFVYWSNVGTSLLSTEQVKRMESIGVIVLQKGSTSPIVNAKINMNRIKRELAKL
ncbi:hypothetical protein [Bizionia sp. M204]|uniref:hypothetical protein n=1 Tax=Bizionia sp. M204 TaxID=2675331 RepID=UPI00206BE191|nr:hypothetical protein [Bizionia sp. M204]UPS92080.1 hypothetical protein GMA17_10260 [Bizionia sp. M204]